MPNVCNLPPGNLTDREEMQSSEADWSLVGCLRTPNRNARYWMLKPLTVEPNLPLLACYSYHSLYHFYHCYVYYCYYYDYYYYYDYDYIPSNYLVSNISGCRLQ